MNNKNLGQKILLFSCALTFSLALGGSPVSANSLTTTTLITPGIEGTGANNGPNNGTAKTLSDNGRIVVFSSQASNLVQGDYNNASDVFVYDRTAKKTELISANANGKPADDYSFDPSVSADGRFVAYLTYAKNIINGTQCTGVYDCLNIIVHDRVTKHNVFANFNAFGERMRIVHFAPPVMSGNGQFVTFNSNLPAIPNDPNDTNDSIDVLVRDLKAGTTKMASVYDGGITGEAPSHTQTISHDGRFITFVSSSAFVQEDLNDVDDVYLRDMRQGTTTLISKAQDGHSGNSPSYNPVISNDGRSVVFTSQATNLVPGDTNNHNDIFLHDISKGKTTRVSVASNGTQTNNISFEPNISKDGRFIVFSSNATTLVRQDDNDRRDIFIHYRDNGITRRVNVNSGDGLAAIGGHSYLPSISGDGTTIGFFSNATNLYPAPLEPSWVSNVYLSYNPVVHIPYYDSDDFLDLIDFSRL